MNHTEIKRFAHCPSCGEMWLNGKFSAIICMCQERKRLREAGLNEYAAPHCIKTLAHHRPQPKGPDGVPLNGIVCLMQDVARVFDND